MEATLLIDITRENLERYFQTHDGQYLHPDAVFINMSNGDTIRGRDHIEEYLHFFYHITFEASLFPSNSIITETQAMVEGHIRGKHIGEFNGIAATGNPIDVPICVTYDMEDGLIRQARVYLLGEVLMQQITRS